MPQFAELVSAFALLTRLPVGGFARRAGRADAAEAVWAYPVVGVVVGLIGGLVYWLFHALGLTPLLAGVLALGAMVLSTGALHEDGLADTADGFGGGATVARKLEIMRDSRTGSYGVIALVLAFALRLGAIAALAESAAVAAALIAAAALARGCVAVFMSLIPPARTDGLSASVGSPDGAAAVKAAILAALVAFLVLSPGIAVAAILAAALVTAAVAALAMLMIDGQTGDVLGAACIAAECAALAAIVATA